jgi:hypothetical protein
VICAGIGINVFSLSHEMVLLKSATIVSTKISLNY